MSMKGEQMNIYANSIKIANSVVNLGYDLDEFIRGVLTTSNAPLYRVGKEVDGCITWLDAIYNQEDADTTVISSNLNEVSTRWFSQKVT